MAQLFLSGFHTLCAVRPPDDRCPPMAGEDLFDNRSEAPAPASSGQKRRVNLYHYDSVAAQLFNPYGASIGTDMDGQKFWKAAAGGNRKAVFHTELAATEESGGAYCVGVGLSRVAETLLAAIEQLEDADLKRLLAAAPLRKAKEEAAALKPHLQVLNAGLAAAESGGSFSALKKKQKTGWAAGEEVDRSEEKATEAARTLHAWLSLEKTPLRHLLIILGGRGAFFAGHMAEKTARTWVRHKPASAEDAIAAAVARAKKGSEKAAAPVGGEGGGLFEDAET